MVADITVTKSTGKVIAKHLTIAQNNGITMGPQLVGNQMTGAAIQGLSRAMWEQPQWNRSDHDPRLGLVPDPPVQGSSVRHAGQRPPGQDATVIPGDSTTDVSAGNTAAFNQGWLATGSGEPPTAAVGSAVANAIFDARARGVRQSPMTPRSCVVRSRRRGSSSSGSAVHGGKGLATGPSRFTHGGSSQGALR